MLKIMYDQYKTITLSGLAEQLHYTVPYCSKYLKNVFGCTFSAIGKEIGYEHTENFFRVFKKHYHMTPSQYRAAIQEETNMQTVCGDRDVIKR